MRAQRRAACGASAGAPGWASFASNKVLFLGMRPNAPSLIFRLAFKIAKPLKIHLRFFAGRKIYSDAFRTNQPLRKQDFDQSFPSNVDETVKSRFRASSRCDSPSRGNCKRLLQDFAHSRGCSFSGRKNVFDGYSEIGALFSHTRTVRQVGLRCVNVVEP